MSVYYSATQEDVTSKAELYVNGAPLTASSFTTTTAGSYTFKAVYEGITSNELTVTAVSGDTADGITLTTSKETIYADGGDFAVLTLKNANGEDVTNLGTFYANGEPLEGNRFSSSKSALAPVTVTAKFNGLDVEESVQILASTNVSFTSRMLVEDITKNNCKYCPQFITLVDELRKDEQPIVVPYSIHNSECIIYSNYYSPATQKFSDDYCSFMGQSDPLKVFINRNKAYINIDLYNTPEKLREEARKGSKEVAIALESSREGTKIEVKATIGSKKDFTGKVVVVLVENGIYANQSELGYHEMYRIMRAYAPSVEGEPKSFKAGEVSTYSATFDLQVTTVKQPSNCEVIAFVTDDADGLCENVQFAKLGEAKGY